MVFYVRSLVFEHGVLLWESLFPVLHYLYLDLVRGSLKDHLKGLGYGPSEELLQFSAELRLNLGEFLISSFKAKLSFAF